MADAAIDNTASARPIDSAAGKLFAGAVLAGCTVALLAGIYGKAHDPASETTVKWFFTSTLHLKAWFTTVALALAILQVLGGMWMFGKLGSRPAPKWVGGAHRITGSLALLFTLPVAYHCLWSLGFNPGDGSGRRLWHSIVGCLFFGAFTTKVLVVRSRRMPGWALPAVGATLFTVLVLIWLTSSLWFFRTIGIEAVNLRFVANIVEGLVAAAVVVFVVLLFTNDPTPPPAAKAEAVAAAGGVDGAEIFGQRCAGCHGGDGSGGIGPRLAGGHVVANFPDPQDQIAVVTNGRGGMPAFGERLSPEEIAAVVDYTRTVLAEVHP